jgi:hypothetical protein
MLGVRRREVEEKLPRGSSLNLLPWVADRLAGELREQLFMQ